MDLRTRTALFCAALAFAIAASVLLRGRVRQVQALFAGFAATVALWYLTQALFAFYGFSSWERATALLAVLMPQLAVRLFTAIVPRDAALLFATAGEAPPPTVRGRAPRLVRISSILGLAMAALVLSPYQKHDAVRVTLFVYVGALTSAGLWALSTTGRGSQSRAARARVRFLVVIGAFATAFSLADFLWFVGARLPPIGAVLSIVFLFVLSQSLQSTRLLDLYDLAGRLLVATALAFFIAAIFWIFVTLVGRFNTMYLNAVLASIAVLVLFNPLQAMVEEKTHQIFFRERFDLESAVVDLRRRLAHVLETREMTEIVMSGLESSRRVTSAAIFLRDVAASEPGGAAFVLEDKIGDATKVVRIEEAGGRLVLERLLRGAVVAEEVERELSDALDLGDAHTAAQLRELHAQLGELGGGAAFAIKTEDGEPMGLLVVKDDRVRDAFSPEEISLLETLAGQLATVVENSLAYMRIKERDRLAALGAMAAGLAHEVKNPLGAIKGAAQLLAEAGPESTDDEFIGIILEEVDRLDRVVSSILDYARPRATEVEPIDVNAAVRRTMQILAPAHEDQVDVTVELAGDLPQARIDPEQLRQVLMNLVTNAVQAMGGRGRLSIATTFRRTARATWPVSLANGAVEIRVVDTGPGISTKVLKNLFVPFFTTKATGTGLGLAISQRIVQNAGGTIEVQTTAGVGTTFTIVLPASGPLPTTSRTQPQAAEGAPASGV
ncbi:MAG: two-component system sensor protein [Deltaproteobacteria bacterium]|nr:two-component system sensor protein [Deltaproteobacteria bacterium]